MRKYLATIALLIAAMVLTTGIAMAQITYSSGIQVQNLSTSNAANVTLTFIETSGATAATVNTSIAASGSVTYFPLPSVSAGFSGSAVVSSDQPIAAIVNVVGNGTTLGSSYLGRSSGATSLSMPIILKGVAGLNTWFSIQNAGTSSATYEVTYSGSACTDTGSIPAGASVTIRQDLDTCLPASYVGAATITSTGGSPQPLVAVNIQERAAVVGSSPMFLLASTAFTSTDASEFPAAPVVVQIGTIQSGISLQNTTGTATNVTVTYTPSTGFPGATCTETKAIPANSATIFAFPSMPAGCTPAGGFAGTALVTTNSAGVNLVGLVNQVNTANGNASVYGMFNPANGTNTVNMPLILDRVGGTLYTAISVQNVGTNNVDVTCTFSGTGYTLNGTLTPGAALTSLQQNQIAAGYIGSGVCTATGSGTPQIVAIVNQLNSALNSLTADGLLTYEAVNTN